MPQASYFNAKNKEVTYRESELKQIVGYTMATLAARSKVPESADNPSLRKGPHIPKEGKKTRRNKAREKSKASSEMKKRGHFSTPLNSDDSEKPQTEEQTSAEKASDPNQVKGHAKERSSRKSRKCKTTPQVVEEDIVPPKEDETAVGSQAQESLRWAGVLEDSAAEEQRLEVYRANRRKRYMALRQTFLENVHLGLGPGSDVSKLSRVQKVGATSKML